MICWGIGLIVLSVLGWNWEMIPKRKIEIMGTLVAIWFFLGMLEFAFECMYYNIYFKY